jgi:hypothetical protein
MRLYTLEEVQQILGLSESAVKNKVFTRKTLRSVKVDTKRYVSEYDLAKYIEKMKWNKEHPKKLKQSADEVKQEYQEKGRIMTTYSHKKDTNDGNDNKD